jgi:type I restriction enzyme, R subunit
MMCDCTVTEGQREREISLNQFPTPEELWQKYCDWKGIDSEIQPIVAQDYYPSPDKKQPRYYQIIWWLWKLGAKQRILIFGRS